MWPSPSGLRSNRDGLPVRRPRRAPPVGLTGAVVIVTGTGGNTELGTISCMLAATSGAMGARNPEVRSVDPTSGRLGSLASSAWTASSRAGALCSGAGDALGQLLHHLVDGEARGFLSRRKLHERGQELSYELLSRYEEVDVIDKPVVVRV